MGKKARQARLSGEAAASVPPSPYEQALADIAQQTYAETAPVRQEWLSTFGDVMGGQYDPTQSPLYSPLFAEGKRGIEGQYGIAKENVLANLPRGGAQARGITDVELARAEQASALPALISKDIMADMLNKAYGTAFGAPGQAMGGFGQAAASMGGKQQAAQQAFMQQQQALWGGGGKIIGSWLGNK